MPLALLLQKTFTALGKGVDKLNDWSRLVQVEELLIERARSAFLVGWFGLGLPFEGLSLRVFIVNEEALKRRYQAVRGANNAGNAASTGLNLTEPLAGLTGTLVGALLSPMSVIVLSSTVASILPRWYTTLLAALSTLTYGVLIPAVVGAVGIIVLPLAFVGAIFVDMLNSESVQQAHALLGAVAELLAALRDFLEQLLGPREQVRNPLLQRLLVLGDKLAVLLPSVIALVAIVFTRIGPLLLPLALQILQLQGLISNVSDLTSSFIDDLLHRVDRLYKGDTSIFSIAIKHIGKIVLSILSLMCASIRDFSKQIVEQLKQIKTTAEAAIHAWRVEIGSSTVLHDVITNHPTVKNINSFIDLLGIVTDLIEHLILNPLPGPIARYLQKKLFSKGTTWEDIKAELKSIPPDTAKITSDLGGEVKVDALLDAATAPLNLLLSARLEKRRGTPVSFDLGAPLLEPPYILSEEGARRVARARHPASIFAGERSALGLHKAAGRETSSLLDAAKQDEHKYRSLLFAVIQKVLTPQLSEYVSQLTDVFRKLETMLYEETSTTEYPVLDLVESSRLQVVIHRLRINASQTDEPNAKAWGESLRRAMEAQTYLVPYTP